VPITVFWLVRLYGSLVVRCLGSFKDIWQVLYVYYSTAGEVRYCMFENSTLVLYPPPPFPQLLRWTGGAGGPSPPRRRRRSGLLRWADPLSSPGEPGRTSDSWSDTSGSPRHFWIQVLQQQTSPLTHQLFSSFVTD
jgi:hypothetical protein